MKNCITIIAYPRSGSTLFMQTLSRFREVTALYEIFHKDSDVAQKGMLDVWPNIKYSLESKYNTSDIERLKEKPSQVIQTIKENISTDYLAYKVFPKHLSSNVMHHLIGKTLPVFLSRNPLDVWISQCFAENSDTWASSNTDKLKLTFDPKHFVLKARYNVRYIAECLSSCSRLKKPWLWYDYNTFKDTGNFIDILKGDLTAYFQYDFQIDPRSNIQLPRQDKRNSARDKVVNPSELEDWLFENRLADLLLADYKLNFADIAGRLELIAQANGWDKNREAAEPVIK